MNFKFMKKGIVVTAFISALLVPSNEALAAGKKETSKFPKISIQSVLDIENLTKATSQIEQYVKRATRDFADMAFAQTDSYVLVRAEASDDSDWTGKLYNENARKIVEASEEWLKIESGNISGYVKTVNVLTGDLTNAKAREILAVKYPGTDIGTLDDETVNNSFAYGESRAEEEARLAAARQSVADFAMQFVGNPYRWGGTSLTRGADCSGFVKSVYANFGISMPRTSSAMRSAGVGISYSEAMPGDVICYPGHVGIYIGNGKIVNAIDDAHGIGVSSATYTRIVTVRRLL